MPHSRPEDGAPQTSIGHEDGKNPEGDNDCAGADRPFTLDLSTEGTGEVGHLSLRLGDGGRAPQLPYDMHRGMLLACEDGETRGVAAEVPALTNADPSRLLGSAFLLKRAAERFRKLFMASYAPVTFSPASGRAWGEPGSAEPYR